MAGSVIIRLSQSEAKLAAERISWQDLLRTVLWLRSDDELKRVVRCWFSEGTPYAFSNFPLAFEKVRDWIAAEFAITPRDVTLIGSARLGYSAEPKHFSTPFRPGRTRNSSDLDLAIISSSLFESCVEAFNIWKSQVDLGKVHPDETQSDSLKRLPNNIVRGFIDPHKVPRQFGKIKTILWRLERLTKFMNAAEFFPETKGATLRVYKSWDAFDNQMLINIRSLKGTAISHLIELGESTPQFGK